MKKNDGTDNRAEIAELEARIEQFGDAIIPDVVELLSLIAKTQKHNWPKDVDHWLDGEDYHFVKGCRYACGIVASAIREWGVDSGWLEART